MPPEQTTPPVPSLLRQWAEAEVNTTLQSLPGPLRDKALRVPVTLESVPSTGLQADGISPDTLGLFTGSEYAEEGHIPMPPQIILFLESLWDFAGRDEDRFRHEVRTTLLHELGHYLGLDEADLTERGLE